MACRNTAVLNIAALYLIFIPLQLFAAEMDFTPQRGVRPLPELACTDENTAYCNQALPRTLLVTPPVVEDPDWYSPPHGKAHNVPSYVGCQTPGQYLPILQEALAGNPVAMADLIIRIQCGRPGLMAAHPDIPAFMHSVAFWLEWATRYTSPGWIYARLALYDDGIGHTRSAYTRGAFLGDPKSMHAYATRWSTGTNMHWLLMAADAGYGPAAHEISRWYRFGGQNSGYSLPEAPNTDMARRYRTVAMNKGCSKAFAYAAFEALANEHGAQTVEDACMYTHIGRVLEDTDNGLLLVDRPLPQLQAIAFEQVLAYALCAVLAPRPLVAQEETDHFQASQRVRRPRNITAAMQKRAMERAVAWLNIFQAQRQADMKVERERRNSLTAQLREQCIHALTYIAKKQDSKTKSPPVTALHTQPCIYSN